VTEEEGDNFLSPAGRRLHREDGSATAEDDHWSRFRLLVEGPEGGVPSALGYGGRDWATAPIKLLEVVAGAVLVVPAGATADASARVVVETQTGRRFRYQARGRAGEDGLARLRVPYPTDASAPTRALTRYQVTSGAKSWQVEVSDTDVRSGSVIRLRP
jgi:hypothetical protein